MSGQKKRADFFISAGFGFALGIIIMLISGLNPLILATSLIKAALGLDFSSGISFNPRFIGEFLVTVMPLWMTGLSVSFAFRAGFFNIGAEGQLIAGSLAAALAALFAPPVPGLHVLFVVAAGVLAGALWGFIPGLLKGLFGVHEVVVTIMMNYAALYLSNYVVTALPGSTTTRSISFPQSSLLHSDLMQALTNNSRLHWGIALSAAAFIAFYVLMERTTLGFSLRATGGNLFAARHAGIAVRRNAALAMAISGAFAGLAGVFMVVGTYDYARALVFFENTGFNGIAVALLGSSSGSGVFYSGLLFGALQAAQPIMQVQRVSKNISVIIIACIIFGIAARSGLASLSAKIAAAFHKHGANKKTGGGA